MIVVIQKDLTAVFKDMDNESLMALSEVRDHLSSISVFNIVTYDCGKVMLTIPAQRITLDEFVMNDLFQMEMQLFKYRLEYADLGHKDFSLNVYPV